MEGAIVKAFYLLSSYLISMSSLTTKLNFASFYLMRFYLHSSLTWFESIQFYLAWLPILPYLTYFLLISPFYIPLPASSPWFFYFNLNLNLLFYLTTSYSLSCTNISFSPSFPLIHSNLFFTILVLVQTSPPPLYSILFHRLLNKVTRRPPSECGYRSYMWIQWSLCSCQGCWMVPTSAWNFGIRGRHCRQVNAECCRRGNWAGGRGRDIIWEW